jgi:hypothetical protein
MKGADGPGQPTPQNQVGSNNHNLAFVNGWG